MMPVVGLLLIKLLVWTVSVDAKYCNFTSGGCCPYSGPDGYTCRGSGTSDVSELVNYLIRGGEVIGILGQPEGFYYIMSVSYILRKGGTAVLRVDSLRAYVLEVPDLKGGFTYYYITVGGCPSISIITDESEGFVYSTRFPIASIVKIIRITNRYPDCNGPCSTLTGASPPNYYQGPFPETDFFLNLDFANIYSLRYDCLDEKCNRYPEKFIRHYNLDIQQGNCTNLWVQNGYMDGIELCVRADGGTPTGRFLATRFNFAKALTQKNGLCLLTTLLNKFGSIVPMPYYLYHEVFRLTAYPYKCAVSVPCYLAQNTGYQFNSPLANVC